MHRRMDQPRRPQAYQIQGQQDTQKCVTTTSPVTNRAAETATNMLRDSQHYSLAAYSQANGRLGVLDTASTVLAAMHDRPADGREQLRGVRTLVNLALQSAADRAAVARAGGGRATVATLRRHNGNPQLAGLCCKLVGVLSDEGAGTRLHLGAEGAVEAVVAVLRAFIGDVTLVVAGCRGLTNLLHGEWVGG